MPDFAWMENKQHCNLWIILAGSCFSWYGGRSYNHQTEFERNFRAFFNNSVWTLGHMKKKIGYTARILFENWNLSTKGDCRSAPARFCSTRFLRWRFVWFGLEVDIGRIFLKGGPITCPKEGPVQSLAFPTSSRDHPEGRCCRWSAAIVGSFFAEMSRRL